jgi:DNA polymerase
VTDSRDIAGARALVAGIAQDLAAWLRAEREWDGESLPRGTDADLPPLPELPALSQPQGTQAPERASRAPAIFPSAVPSGRQPPAPPRPAVTPVIAPPPELLAIEERGQGGLDRVRAVLGDCTRCKLSGGRANLVFGEGAARADLMFIGEAPGADEDRLGRPFVGRAGELLDRMISAMGLARADVYIANVCKCRPPNNRDPEVDEVAACRPFLLAQVRAIEPKVVVSLGRVATQTLLATDERISKLRGRWQRHPELAMQVMPTYHPAALLRNPTLKRPVWEDLQQVMALLRGAG